MMVARTAGRITDRAMALRRQRTVGGLGVQSTNAQGLSKWMSNPKSALETHLGSSIASQASVPVATLIVSILIALAPKLGPYPVAAASVFWIIAVALRVALVARHCRHFTLPLWILACATLLASLRMISTGLVQVISDRSSFFSNVDWRYAATQAHGIARFGGLGDSLDYAGEPVNYHVGPSWIAGSLNYVMGIPINGVLLIAIPATSIAVISLCGYTLLRLLGASKAAAALALTVLLSIPASPYFLLRRIYGSFRGQSPLLEVLNDAEQWWFSPDFMINSLFAVAVGLSAAVLLAGQPSNSRVLMGGCGLASLFAIKPQYAIGFLAVLGIGLLCEWWRGEAFIRRTLYFVCSFAVSAAAAAALNPSAISFTGIQFSLGAEVLQTIDPRLGLIPVVVLLIGGIALRRDWRRRHATALTTSAIGAAIGSTVLVMALGSTTLLVDSETISRANEVGLPYTLSSQDPNLSQALRPAVMVLVAVGTALLVGHWQGRSVIPRLLTGMSIILVALTIPLTVFPLADPTGAAAYEVSEEADLLRLMSMTRENEGRWLSNDIADPAQDFARPLRGTSLTSFSSAQFYVSNVAYMGWTQPDVVQRMRNVQRFFNADWSSWHADFLRENSVTYIIIRDRCPTAWAAERAGQVVGTSGAWTLVEANIDSFAPRKPSGVAEYGPSQPKYGLSGCLDGRGPLP